MKTKISSIFFAVIMTFIIGQSLAQSPEAFNYQAVARDAAGLVLDNQPIAIRVSLHNGSASGVVDYSETFAPTTNEFGLFTLAIGTGSVVSGDFSTLSWGSAQYWLQVEMDPTGGASYADMGTSQLLSVPYAMYAAHSESIGFSAYRTDTVQPIPPSSYTGIIFNALNYDDGNGYDLTTGFYTVPSAGVYHFDASVRLTGTATAGQVTVITFAVNGSNKRMKRMLSELDDFSVDISSDFKLNAGDIVKVQIFSGMVTDATYINNQCTFFSGHKVY